jgi:hypothetical protein
MRVEVALDHTPSQPKLSGLERLHCEGSPAAGWFGLHDIGLRCEAARSVISDQTPDAT